MTRYSSFALAAFAMAACSEAEPPAEPLAAAPAPAEATPNPAPLGVTLAGRDIAFIASRARLRMPEGWRAVEASGPFLVIEAERYASDLERWARCEIRRVVLPSLGASQAALNDGADRLAQDAVRELEAEGVDAEVTYPQLHEDAAARIIRYTADETDVTVQLIATIEGIMMQGAMIFCDTTTPATEQDKSDIEGLFRSFSLEAPIDR